MSDLNECISKCFSFTYDKDCLMLLLAKAVGIMIIISSATLKVPQIKEMLANPNSSLDLSEFSLITDIITYLVSASYNKKFDYPLTAYGEIILLFFQTIFIYYLFVKNSKNSYARNAFIFIFIVVTIILLEGNYVPINFWPFIANSAIFFNIMSRSSSIIQCYNSKSAGPLKPFASFLSATGNFIRALTFYQETSDMLMVAQSIIALVLNLTLLSQIIYYGKNDSKSDINDKKQK